MSKKSQEGKISSRNETKIAERAKERLRRHVTNQPHPLERLNWLQILTFMFLSPIYQYVKTGQDFKPKDNFRAPEALRCQANLKRAERILQAEGRLVWKLVKEFKIEFIMKALRMLSIIILELYQIVVSKNLVDILQAYLSQTTRIQPQLLEGSKIQALAPDSEVTLQSVMTLVLTFFAIQLTTCLIGKMDWILSNVFLTKVKISFETLLFEKKLGSKFNDIHAKRFKVDVGGSIEGLMDALFELLLTVESVSHALFILSYGFFSFGWKLVILIIGVFLSSSYKTRMYKENFKFEVEYHHTNIETNSVMDSVFDNLQHIKINSLENFYFRKNEAVRENLRGITRKMQTRGILIEMVANLISLVSKCLFLGAYLLSGGVLSAGFVKIFMELNNHILGSQGLSKLSNGLMHRIDLEERILIEVFDDILIFRI